MIRYLSVLCEKEEKTLGNDLWFPEKTKPDTPYIKLRIKWSYEPRFDTERKSNLLVWKIKKLIKKIARYLLKISEV